LDDFIETSYAKSHSSESPLPSYREER
jgi:hypothetical protein